MSRYRRQGFLGLFRRRPQFSRYNLSGGFFGLNWNISAETKKGIFIVLLFTLAALSILGLLGLYGDNQFGKIVIKILGWLLGGLKWLFPIMALLFGYFLLRGEKYEVKTINYFGGLLLILGLTGLWHLRFPFAELLSVASQGKGGGFLGLVLSYPLLRLMDFWGTLVVLLAVAAVGALLTFETSIHGLLWPMKLAKYLWEKAKGLKSTKIEHFKKEEDDYEEEVEAAAEEKIEPDQEEKTEAAAPAFKSAAIGSGAAEEKNQNLAIGKLKKFGKRIELPPSLLTDRSGKPTSGDIKNNQMIIKKTLANFGIEVEMADINIGPTVTQYTFRPADGVKLSKIVALNNDLALALAAHPIRIEAPIPGRSLVGVEMPNKVAARVTMNELLASKVFQVRENNLMLALGKDVSGRPYFCQLDKMPHLLIAGATGSGKSVCINSIIISLLFQNSPDELKFILVDPKRVELPLYNSIPYLLTPVITDVKKTINALRWTVGEMERRFELLSKVGKRNIASFNQSHSDKLPYIVFIIDELADLMNTAANDVEGGIVRLAQMARAVGIHLILATQRPSVEVITGLIKANIPARIAFAVASAIDSRTILDTSGAEKLVGRGDMLYLGPELTKPKRLQGVYLSDKEINNVIDHIKNQGEADYQEGVVERTAGAAAAGGDYFGDDGDSLLGEAKDIIRQSGKASASLLQRRLKIGYARAARILDLLEEQGVIGPADGAKPREVFLDKLGQTNALEFAAREHDLTGELAPFTQGEESVEPAEAEVDEDEFADGGEKLVFREEQSSANDLAGQGSAESEEEKEESNDDNDFIAEENNVADKESEETGEESDQKEETKTEETEAEESVEAETAEEEIEIESESTIEDKKSTAPDSSAKRSFADDEWT